MQAISMPDLIDFSAACTVVFAASLLSADFTFLLPFFLFIGTCGLKGYSVNFSENFLFP